MHTRNLRVQASFFLSIICSFQSALSAASYRISTLALSGEIAVGTEGGVYKDLGAPLLNDHGAVAYYGLLKRGVGDATVDRLTGIWTESGLLVRAGDVAPGSGGARFSSVYPEMISNSGNVLNAAGLVVGTGDATEENAGGLWVNDGPVVRLGESAKGTTGAVYNNYAASWLNSSGTVPYWGSLTLGLGDTTSSNDLGLWSGSELIVRKGDGAPGTEGATYDWFQIPAINDRGDIAYLGSLNIGVGDTVPKNSSGLWTRDGLVVRSGSIAAGTVDARYVLFLPPSINEHGLLAYYAQLDTAENWAGIWTSQQLVARTGAEAPGIPGAEFDSFDWNPSLNDAGDVAFRAGLRLGTGDVLNANNEGIWTSDGIVVRKGDLIEVSPGKWLAVTGLSLSDSAIDNSGQIAFWAQFKGGIQGAFLATPVPESSSAVLLLLGLIGFKSV